MTLPDPIRRALRTWLQTFLATLLPALGASATGVLPTPEGFLSVLTYAGYAASIAVLAALLSALQNAGEDRKVIPTILPK